jgi:thioredoxin-related protein
MIPHSRKMVEHMKEKPFAMISLSVDDDKEDLTGFLKKEAMPWVHWWQGSSKGLAKTWNVHSFPTIYVIDAKGVIRYKNIRDQELEKAVTGLVAEAEAKK